MDKSPRNNYPLLWAALAAFDAYAALLTISAIISKKGDEHFLFLLLEVIVFIVAIKKYSEQ